MYISFSYQAYLHILKLLIQYQILSYVQKLLYIRVYYYMPPFCLHRSSSSIFINLYRFASIFIKLQRSSLNCIDLHRIASRFIDNSLFFKILITKFHYLLTEMTSIIRLLRMRIPVFTNWKGLVCITQQQVMPLLSENFLYFGYQLIKLKFPF